MGPIPVEIMDCKIPVRKYILVSQPSRWRKSKERVVVQSPMTQIPKNVSHVPVRRFNGEEPNTVCFIPREDIERDSSDVYQRLHVSKSPSKIDAHGVALFDNSSSDDLQYCHGDKFWISIDANTKESDNFVPVINLRTCESGTIAVDHVCWYPRIQGTTTCSKTQVRSQALWTPGGKIWHLKLSGSKKFKYWSWGICQYLDGSPTTTGNIELPSKESRGEDKWHLSILESSSLFQARCRLMFQGLCGSKSLMAESCPGQPGGFLLPTPPISPELDLSQQLAEGKVVQVKSAAVIPVYNVVWRGIMEEKLPTPRPILKRGRIASTSMLPLEYDSDSSSLSSGSATRNSSPARRECTELINPEYESIEPRDIRGALNLYRLSIFRAKEDLGNKPCIFAFSAADPGIAIDPTLIRANWDANRPGHTPKLDDLCDIKDSECPYTTRYTCKHYHPDPSKCLLTQPSSAYLHELPSAPYSRLWIAWSDSSAEDQDRHKNHQHCITRLRPYPDGAGECMLAGNPLRKHVCCHWREGDFDGLPRIFVRAYHESKIAEAWRNMTKIHDRSDLVDIKSSLVDSRIPIGDDEYRLGGKMLKDTLDKGLFESEVGDTHMSDFMIELSGDLQSDKDTEM